MTAKEGQPPVLSREVLSLRKSLMQWKLLFIGCCIGSAFFLVGSYIFLPNVSATGKVPRDTILNAIAVGLFCMGVISFAICSPFSIKAFSSRHRTSTALLKYSDLFAETLYMGSYVFYFAGSVLFLAKFGGNVYQYGAVSFVIGSICFCIGLVIKDAIEAFYNCSNGTMATNPFFYQILMLDNSASFNYFVGALIWLLGSVCYLIKLPESLDEEQAGAVGNIFFSLGSYLYISGSVFFFLGSFSYVVAMILRLRLIDPARPGGKDIDVYTTACTGIPDKEKK